MERTELTRLKSLFGSNLLGPDELQPLVSRWGNSETPRLETPPLNYSWADLESHAKDYILVMGIPTISGIPVTLRNLREVFGIDPEQQEPCFYNQDWYLNESFLDTKLENRWYLLKKDVFESSRAELPDKLSKEISFPSAVLCAYTFFAYYLYYKQPLCYHDFIGTYHIGDGSLQDSETVCAVAWIAHYDCPDTYGVGQRRFIGRKLIGA